MSSRAMSLALAVAVLLLSGPITARGQEQPTLPGEKCSVPPPDIEPQWTAQEKWVWKEICESRPADLNKRPNGSRIDPKKKWELKDDRIISERFLKTILLRKPFKDAIPENAVVIIGALFQEELDFPYAKIDANLEFDKSRFEAPVSFVGAEFKSGLHINESRFEQELDLNFIHVGESLFMGYGSEFDEVGLTSARVDRQVIVAGAEFTGPLTMINIQIGGDLLMVIYEEHQAEFARVDLIKAKVDGLIGIVGAKFSGRLNMGNIQIGGDLIISNEKEHQAEFEDVDLSSATVNGEIGMHGAKFNCSLNMNSIQVGGNLFLRNTEEYQGEFKAVNLIGAKIEGWITITGAKFSGNLHMGAIQVGGNLLLSSDEAHQAEFATASLSLAKVDGSVVISGAKFNGPLFMERMQVGGLVAMNGPPLEKIVTLFGSRISGDLQFSNGETEVSWGQGASLDLRQARLQVIHFSERSLPERTTENPQPLLLEGLQYQRMVTYEGSGKEIMMDANWYKKNWLEKGEFSSQVYKQLADALERDDRPEVAEEILYASKEKQRHRAEGLSKFDLTAQWLLIGYGYRNYKALYWFGWLVAFGALVHLRVTAKPKQGLADLAESLFFSLDMLIPVLKLDESHYEKPVPGWQRYYFGAHIIFGFILVSFILAGVSGLTK